METQNKVKPKVSNLLLKNSDFNLAPEVTEHVTSMPDNTLMVHFNDKHEYWEHWYYFNKDLKLTVVSLELIDPESEVMSACYIGVAKCGKGQKCDMNLGHEIAVNRAKVKPNSIIEHVKMGSSVFRALCEHIAYEAKYSQWQHKHLDRIDK